jgi:hypothetical protein
MLKIVTFFIIMLKIVTFFIIMLKIVTFFIIMDTQEEKRHVAYVHCHADQIKLGNYTQLLFVCNS